jgi:hypothetical protein
MLRSLSNLGMNLLRNRQIGPYLRKFSTNSPAIRSQICEKLSSISHFLLTIPQVRQTPGCLKKFIIPICLALFLLVPFGRVQQVFAEVSEVQDPTRPSQIGNGDFEKELPSVLQGWDLTTTLISPRRSIAIINGSVFQKGQVLEGAKIVAIQQGAVELRHGESSLWLYATAGIEKKRHLDEGELH